MVARRGYVGLQQILRERIEAGVYSPGERIPSRAAIMRQFQFARATVDRAINGLIEADALRAEKGGGTYVIDHDKETRARNVFYIVSHREVEPRQTSLFPFIDTVRSKLVGEYGKVEYVNVHEVVVKPERFVRDARAMFLCQFDPRYLETALFLKKRRCPILLVNRQDHRFDYVSTDAYAGTKAALERTGAKRVGMVYESPSFDRPYKAEREAAFFRAAATLGLETRDEWFAEADLDQPEAGIDRIMAMLSKPERPEALFISGFLAPYVLTATRFNKLTLGRDLALVHFDPRPETEGREGVIQLEQDFQAMGLKALEWVKRLNGVRRAPFQVHIAPKIVMGKPNHELSAAY